MNLFSIHREVIERKPEEFKIKCLKNILSLFPSSAANPFMAGFGNRVNVSYSYIYCNVFNLHSFTHSSTWGASWLREFAFLQATVKARVVFATQLAPPQSASG